MDSIVYFLTYKYNKKNLIGIIGCGNRNFNGTEEDVEKGRGNYHEHRALPLRFLHPALPLRRTQDSPPGLQEDAA